MLLRALLLFLLLIRSASAQTITPNNRDSVQASAAVAEIITSADDTIRALHRLYNQRRTGGFVLTTLGGGYFLYVSVITPFALAFGGAGLVPVVSTALIIGGTTTGISIKKLVKFSKSREARVVTDYEQNKKLPPEIRRILKPKFFRAGG